MAGRVLKTRRAALALAAGIAIAGCLAQVALRELRGIRAQRVRPVLSMGRHVNEWDCTCVGCHPGVDKKGQGAGVPDRRSCLANCHEALQDVDNFALGAVYLDEAGKPRWKVVSTTPEGVRFGHAKHLKTFGCVECHGNILRDDYRLAGLAGDFRNCERCHVEAEAAGSCSFCHKSLPEKSRPHSHARGWETGHAAALRLRGGMGQARRTCLTCHKASACVDCHSSEAPRDHSTFWKRAGHGIGAGIERDRCTACHTPGVCISCHLDRAPPMVPDADHYPPILNGCTAFPGCHYQETSGHTVLTTNCLLCHR
jgi:hypothetical protein